MWCTSTLRARRALLLCKVYGICALLVLSGFRWCIFILLSHLNADRFKIIQKFIILCIICPHLNLIAVCDILNRNGFYFTCTLYESKLLVSKQPGDQWLLVLSEGLGNEDSALPKDTTATASRFEPRSSWLRVCGLIHWATTAPMTKHCKSLA